VKRRGNLVSKIAEMNNLFLAWHKARRGKIGKDKVLDYEKNLDVNLSKLKNELQSGQLSCGDYTYFKIYDPKERIICAASFTERVMHHAIMNVCHPYFEKHLIFDTYATRKHKGTYAALDRASLLLKKFDWFAKLDIRKYFDNINHGILLKQLNLMFKDKVLLNMFVQIIQSYRAGFNSGVPIGNLTSQYFANHYLSGADHFAFEELKAGAFIRYMDDMVFFENDKNSLKSKVKAFAGYLGEKLQLETKPLLIGNCHQGLPFLGYKLYRHKTMLNKRSKRRFVLKLTNYNKLLNSEKWDERQYQAHILPLLSFTEYADSLYFRKKHTFAPEG